jgi:hypothetical protein
MHVLQCMCAPAHVTSVYLAARRIIPSPTRSRLSIRRVGPRPAGPARPGGWGPQRQRMQLICCFIFRPHPIKFAKLATVTGCHVQPASERLRTRNGWCPSLSSSHMFLYRIFARCKIRNSMILKYHEVVLYIFWPPRRTAIFKKIVWWGSCYCVLIRRQNGCRD